jgi:hypothetical protein
LDTPATDNTPSVAAYCAAGDPTNLYSPFYSNLGGVQPISGPISGIVEPSETYPNFNSDLIIRGGLLTMEVYNNHDYTDVLKNDMVRCRIVLIKTSPQYDESYALSTVTTSWQFGLEPDFRRRVGVILLQKYFSIKDGESCCVSYRLPCQKIDIGSYSTGVGIYKYLIALANGFEGESQSCRVRFGHQIVFCGDTA